MEPNNLLQRLERFLISHDEMSGRIGYSHRREFSNELFKELSLIEGIDRNTIFGVIFVKFVALSKAPTPDIEVWRVLTNHLIEQGIEFQSQQMEDLEWCLQQVAARREGFFTFGWNQDWIGFNLKGVFKSLTSSQVENWHPLLKEIRQALSEIWCAGLDETHLYGSNSALFWLVPLLGTRHEMGLERGDSWADCAIADLEAMEASQRAIWLSLFEHAQASKEAKPTEKWLKRADQLLQLVGRDEFSRRAQKWFSLFGKDDGYWFADREEHNDAHFKGLIWMASRLEDAAIVPALGAALRGSFKARGRAGVRSQRVGNACIWALGRRDESEAASHLVAAKNRVKNGAILKTLEKLSQSSPCAPK